MNINKREQAAIDSLFEVALALKEGRSAVGITGGKISSIKTYLGIDLLAATKTKTQVGRNLRKGKEGCLLNFEFYNNGVKSRHCYFPFQVNKNQMDTK